MARKRYRSDVVDVLVRLDNDVYRQLSEKFENVEELLRMAAEQLAMADEKNIAAIMRLDKQYELVNMAYSFLMDFVQSLRTVKTIEPSLVNDQSIYEYVIHVLAMKYAVLRRTLKLLKSLRVPHQYKKRVEALLLSANPDYGTGSGGGDSYAYS